MQERARSHKDLIVWQKAMLLCEQVYLLTEHFPQREIYGLSSQIRRAAVFIQILPKEEVAVRQRISLIFSELLMAPLQSLKRSLIWLAD